MKGETIDSRMQMNTNVCREIVALRLPWLFLSQVKKYLATRNTQGIPVSEFCIVL